MVTKNLQKQINQSNQIEDRVVLINYEWYLLIGSP